MAKLSIDKAQQLKDALNKLSSLAFEIANIVDETEFELTSAPYYMSDLDDFAYEIASMVEDEIIAIDDAVN